MATTEIKVKDKAYYDKCFKEKVDKNQKILAGIAIAIMKCRPKNLEIKNKNKFRFANMEKYGMA